MYIVKKNMTGFVLVALLIMHTTACKKEAAAKEEEEPAIDTTTTPTDTVFYKLTRVQNFAAIAVDDASNTPPTLYYSLESKKEIAATYAKTRQWDIAFGGLYNSFISGNNGANGANYGSGSSGVGGVLVLEQAFDAVTTVPNDALFKTRRNTISVAYPTIVNLNAAGLPSKLAWGSEFTVRGTLLSKVTSASLYAGGQYRPIEFISATDDKVVLRVPADLGTGVYTRVRVITSDAQTRFLIGLSITVTE